MPGTDDGSRLQDLSKRLDEVRAAETSKEVRRNEDNRGIGIALRMATELVVAVIVGGAIGWYLDGWFGTEPWLMVVFFFLGMGAGFLNVFRAAAAISKVDENEE